MTREKVEKMELINITTKTDIELQVTYQRQGNDKNGNPIYIINIFKESSYKNFNHDNFYNNITYFIAERNNIKLDKYNNIKIRSYNINADIQYLCNSITE